MSLVWPGTMLFMVFGAIASVLAFFAFSKPSKQNDRRCAPGQWLRGALCARRVGSWTECLGASGRGIRGPGGLGRLWQAGRARGPRPAQPQRSAKLSSTALCAQPGRANVHHCDGQHVADVRTAARPARPPPCPRHSRRLWRSRAATLARLLTDGSVRFFPDQVARGLHAPDEPDCATRAQPGGRGRRRINRPPSRAVGPAQGLPAAGFGPRFCQGGRESAACSNRISIV